MVSPVIRLRGIRKSFAGNVAVDGVDLDLFPGEVHALVGENGAGKSTLMRVLAGMFSDYEGTIEVEGKIARIKNPGHARGLGIALVHQELFLVPELSIAENIFLGREPASIPGFISRKKINERARALLGEIGVSLAPRLKTGLLSVACRQLVEIAKGLSVSPRVLILDEPTASLTELEIAALFDVIRRLKAKQTAVVYISHKLSEVFAVAGRITVLRDGALVATDTADRWDEPSLVRAMVGRELSILYPHTHASDNQEAALTAHDLTRRGAFSRVSFTLRRGEVLGIYGLIGAGRSELAEAIFGLAPATGGALKVFGRRVRIRSPRDAMALGIALVPEDRRGRGLVLMHAVSKNLSLPVLSGLSTLGFVRRREERDDIIKIMSALGISAAAYGSVAANLSGGNQQKVVIGKWLMRPPRILVLDEPTRGIDVGAKAEVHALIDRLAVQGMAIILISSELPEVMGMSDRVLVMRHGGIAGEFARENATTQALGAAAAGVAFTCNAAGGAA
ncbi:MAG TPA: sugar ABC transporter ATP-binding protein [bacterium]|nr:sugar ABC transporter ATP-binding protein [bacterium]